jgi:DNA polymerase-3 subunit delta'
MNPAIDSHPWLQTPWHKLTQQRDRMPHALLINGQAGLGKNRLAIELAHWLLCTESRGDEACGHCKNCQLFNAKTHPDIKVVTQPEEGKAISIDQIRELNRYLSLTPHTSTRKVVIVTPAEEMTTAAANSLLKQLEEPPLGSILLLVSHQPHRLPQTIRSRCSRVEIKPPKKAVALEWLTGFNIAPSDASAALAAAGGAPLAALALAEEGFIDDRKSFLLDLIAIAEKGGNPVACAERWQQRGSDTALNWFHGFLLDLLKAELGANDPQGWNNPDAENEVKTAARRIPVRKAAELLQAVTEAIRLLSTPVDQRLLLEDILIRWNRATAQ